MTNTNNIELYHGRFANVEHLNNDAQAIAGAGTLNWKACKVPLVMQGHKEYRAYTPAGDARQRYAIVNCSNATVIDGGKPVGKDFKLVDNMQILSDACQFATEAGMTIKHAGQLDGGRLVVIEAEFPGLRNLMEVSGTYSEKIQQREAAGLKKGDAVAGGVTIIASHQPGRKTRVRSFLRRLSCMNGMTVVGNLRALSLSHRNSYNDKMRAQLQAIMQQVAASFDGHIAKVDMLTGCNVSREIQQAHIIATVQPGLLDAVLAETVKRGICGKPRSLASFVVDELASKDIVQGLLRNFMQDTGKRVLDKIVGILDTQPGVQTCRGTLAQSYHAVTHHFDHNYGRANNPDGAVEYALTGKGDETKTAALNFGLELVAATQQR